MNRAGEVVWLVELFRSDATSIGLAVGISSRGFSAVPYDKALRFARQNNAEALVSVIDKQVWSDEAEKPDSTIVFKAVEHMWSAESGSERSKVVKELREWVDKQGEYENDTITIFAIKEKLKEMEK